MYIQSVATDKGRGMRKRDLEEQDHYVSKKHAQRRKGQNFAQVHSLGWKHLRELFRGNPGAAGLYSMLAGNIDGSCDAIVADQSHLASLLDVGR